MRMDPVTDTDSLTDPQLALIDAYWRAANYLSVGQIYLLANPLLRERLRPEHVKPRLLGHWGTTPGLNFIYAHLNRVIRDRQVSVLYVTGPGHGGPGIVANTYLEGTYSEVYPQISEDIQGMAKLFRQFSFPGGIPSHVAPETPGSIHEGGELGYSLSHAYGAAFDNPDLWSHVWSAMARRRLVLWPPAGTPISSSIRPRRCCAANPSFERLQDRQPHRSGTDLRGRTAPSAGWVRLSANFVSGSEPD